MMVIFEFSYCYLEIDENFQILLQRLKKNFYCFFRCVWKFCVYYLFVLKFFKYYKFKEYVLMDFLMGLIIGIMYILQVLVFGLFVLVKVENGFYILLWLILFYVIFGILFYIFMGISVVICMVIVGVVDIWVDEFKF